MEKRSNLLNSSQKTECTSDSSDFQDTSVSKRATTNPQTDHNLKADRKVVFSNNASDDFQFEQIDDLQYEPENSNTNSLNTLSNLKNEVNKYKKILNEKQFTIREIKLELDEATSKNKELEMELNALKIDQKHTKSAPNNNNSIENLNNSTFSTFEELLKKNNDQISSLSEARFNLINLIQKYQLCFDEAEAGYKRSQDALSDLHNSILEMIPPEMLNEIQKMQNQPKSQQATDSNNANRQNKQSNNHDNNLTKEGEITNSKEEEEKNQILQILHYLINDRCYSSTTSKYYSSANSAADSMISVCNDDQILGHLENALYFIRTLSKSDYKENPIEDSELKQLIEDQCKKIEEFLKINEPTKVSSIFGDNGSIDEQLKAFYNMTNKSTKSKKRSNNSFEEDEEENLNEEDLIEVASLSPEVRSLFSLFTAAVEVNKILFDRNRILEREYKKFRKSNKEMKSQRDQMKNEIVSTEKAILEIKDKIEKNLGHNVDSVDNGLDEFCEILAKTSDIIDIKDNETEKLKKSILKLKKSNSSLSNQLKAKEKQIASLVKKLNEAKFEKENAQKELNATIEKVKAEKENVKYVKEREVHPKEEEIDEVDRDEIDFDQKEDERISLTQQLQEAQEQNKILQNQLSNITKEMDNYQASSDFNVSNTSNYEAQVTSLKGKLKKLKIQKARNETQLQSELEENKKRNEQLENSYRNQLEQLNKELNTVRYQYIAQKELNQDAKAKQENNYMQLAKGKAIQKKLEAELKEAKESIKLTQQQNELKIKALKMSFEKMTNDTKKKISDITKKLTNAVNLNNNNNSEFTIDDLQQIVDLIDEKYDFKVIKDAALAKEKLRIGKRQRLSYAVDKLHLRIMELEKKVLSKENEKTSLQRKYEKKLKEYNSVTQSVAYREATEWKKWVESIYSKLNEGEVCPINIMETKVAIERAIEENLRPVSFDRKLNILRNEKKILSIHDIRTVVESKYKSPVTSLRPMMIMMLFLRKIECYATDTDSQVDDSIYIDESEENENE